VGVLPSDLRLVPAHALHADDDADVLSFGLENRPLLDVQLEERRERMRPALLRSAIADRLERRAEGLARAVLTSARPVARDRAVPAGARTSRPCRRPSPCSRAFARAP